MDNLKEADKLYIVGRTLSVLCALFTIYVFYLLIKNIFGYLYGILGALLVSILPAHVFNSVYVRPDIMMLLFLMLVLYFTMKYMVAKEKI